MSVSTIVLRKILVEDSSLHFWTKLKSSHFPIEYQPLFRSISSFFAKNGRLPSLEELKIVSHRNISDESIFSHFFDFEIPEDIALDIAVDALLDEHVQSNALDKMEKLVLNISSLAKEEIIENVYSMAYELERDSQVIGNIYTVQDIDIFSLTPMSNFIPLGLSTEMDAHITGICRGETLLIGGMRGNGKSLVCSNIAVNEYLAGYVIPYFTIEMRAEQIFRRNLGIEAGINAQHLRNMSLTVDDRMQLARTLIRKYKDADHLFDEFVDNSANLVWLQTELKSKSLIQDNQIIIIDNPQLSLVEIDTNLARLKSMYGDKMRMCVIDYLNQIKVPDIYNWESQIYISKTLKEMAAKYEIALAIPYQIDKTGEARFSKGILDSADLSVIITANKAEDNPSMTFTSTKARDLGEFQYASIVDWDTLRITGERATPISIEDKDKKKGKEKDEALTTGEGINDL